MIIKLGQTTLRPGDGSPGLHITAAVLINVRAAADGGTAPALIFSPPAGQPVFGVHPANFNDALAGPTKHHLCP